MKKFVSVIGICGMAMLTAFDCNAAVKSGDKVEIDFSGFLGDVQFEGGSGAWYPLTLGQNEYVPGFDDKIIGMNVGETREFRLTMPSDFGNGVSGKTVNFTVTLRSIID